MARLRNGIVSLAMGLVSLAEAGPARSFTLEQAVLTALEQNPQMMIAQKEVEKAQAGVWEAYGVLMPTLDATAAVNHSWDIQTTTIPNFLKPMLEPLAPSIPEFANMPDYVEMSFGMENVATYGASLRQPLFLGGAGIAGVRLARAATEASQHELELLRQNLIYGTTLSFYRCLLARELVRVEDEAVAQAEANLASVRAHYDVGSASGFDLMRAEVEVANLKPEVIASRNDYQAALTGLRTILGLPPDEAIAVEGDLVFEPDDAAEQSLATLQQSAAALRPELRALRAQTRMAAQGVAIARSGFLPKVFFSTDYSRQAMRNDWDFATDDFSTGFSSAISVQMPVFDGFRNVKAHEKARLDRRIMNHRERQLMDAIAGEVEVAHSGVQVAGEKCRAAQESIALAREALRLANLRYEEGASTQLDVLGSQLSLRRAELNHASALFEYQMARYRLRLATGTLTEAR